MVNMSNVERPDSHQLTPRGSPLFTPHQDNNVDNNVYQLPTIIAIQGMENTAIIKLSGDELLNLTNWIVWHERMYIMLQLCEVYEYTQGEIERPNSLIDPQGARNWLKNDNYTKHTHC